MIKNVGKVDMIARIVIGVALALYGIVNQSWWGLLSIILFATAFINFCPIWAIFKINTCKIKE